MDKQINVQELEDILLPKETNALGKVTVSSCNQYQISDQEIKTLENKSASGDSLELDF